MNTQTSFDKLTPELQAQVMRKKLVDAISTAYLPADDKPTWTPFELCEEMLEGVDLKGEILVLSDLGFIPILKKRGVDLTRVTLVVHTIAQEELARALMKVNRISVGRIWNVGYNSCIDELEAALVGLKFDIVVGNPPFNGKSSIHLKMVGLMERVLTLGGQMTLILPKPILVRQSDRCKQYTSWLDSTSCVEHHDINMMHHFPQVGDDLIWFSVRNDHGQAMTDITVLPPGPTWTGKYVTGLDYHACKKKPEGEYQIPVINCVHTDGTPTMKKFTKKDELKKLAPWAGKPCLHVNAFRVMDAVRDNGAEVAMLDETGNIPFYRHYMETIVFDSLQDARDAFAWIKSTDGKKYFSDWLKTGWGISTGLKLLIKPQ